MKHLTDDNITFPSATAISFPIPTTLTLPIDISQTPPVALADLTPPDIQSSTQTNPTPPLSTRFLSSQPLSIPNIHHLTSFNTHHMLTKAKSGIFKPNAFVAAILSKPTSIQNLVVGYLAWQDHW